MAADDRPVEPPPPAAGSLAASLRWTRFRGEFAARADAHRRGTEATRVDPRPLAEAFWAWASVLEHDAAFEALDPVDYAHFAAGQLLARLLTHRPILVPPLASADETRVLTETVLDHLHDWRRAHGAAPFARRPVDADAAPWASFLENTTAEPELAVAFLDEFTGVEPVWRYPQLISERPAMRRARRAEREPRGAA